jgi:hypothetical protein
MPERYTGRKLQEAKLELCLCFGKLMKFEGVFDRGFDETQTKTENLISRLPEKDRGLYESKYHKVMEKYRIEMDRGKDAIWRLGSGFSARQDYEPTPRDLGLVT